MTERAVKFIDEDNGIIGGLAIPFGGPMGVKDLDGEFFTAETDFRMADYTSRPVRYQHARDATIGWTTIGSELKAEKTDVGIWLEAQLDISNRYVSALLEQGLIKDGRMGWSSGAQDSGVLIDYTTGEIKRWPWVETSLTPNPANPYAMIAGKSLTLSEIAENAEKSTALSRLLGRNRGDRSIAEIAAAIEISEGALRSIMRGGTQRPSKAQLLALSGGFGVSIERMLGARASDGVDYEDDPPADADKHLGELKAAQLRLRGRR